MLAGRKNFGLIGPFVNSWKSFLDGMEGLSSIYDHPRIKYSRIHECRLQLREIPQRVALFIDDQNHEVFLKHTVPPALSGTKGREETEAICVVQVPPIQTASQSTLAATRFSSVLAKEKSCLPTEQRHKSEINGGLV